ncbi:MAG TPA: coniferyl aldehyde dehydrogenase [Burkholderiales bacterium]
MSAVTETQPVTDRMRRILERQRAAFLADMNPPCAVRRDRLDRLLAMTERHTDALVAAISEDFGHRSRQETLLTDVLTVIAAIKHARRHLKRWMKPRRAPTALQYRPAHNRILRQPLGVVGIVSPWNYPYQLAVGPAVGALAAGNRVMIKPSELTPRLAALLARIAAETFAEDELAVVTGDASVGQAFVELPFDHLLFTGSTHVGRLVAQAAAKNLTPVTLELGGKSPAIVDASADLRAIAPRIAYAKLLNAGQTCIAPDYALVPAAKIEAFAEALRGAIERLYPEPLTNPDYTSIVNERHYRRLRGLVEDARAKGGRVLEIGARADASGRKFPPTLVLDARAEMRVMQEEIFGPILPVVGYATLDDALRFVNGRDRPLALYWFGDDRANRERALRGTIAGGVTVNDCLLHFAQEDLPFGGVGASGMGAYHGEHGFRTFSKEKPVTFQSKLNGMALVYPPYGRTFDRVAALLKRLL